jgi:hypothetical protein
VTDRTGSRLQPPDGGIYLTKAATAESLLFAVFSIIEKNNSNRYPESWGSW